MEFRDFNQDDTKTNTNTDLSELLAKQDGGDLLTAVAEAVLELIMEAEVEGVIGASKHERANRKFHGAQGRRPDDHPGLSDPGP